MNKKNIISLISLVGGLALIFFLINPLWSSIKVLKTELIEQENKISEVEELLDRVQQIEQDYQKLEKDALKIFSALPKEENLPRLLVQFDDLASNNGLLLESIKFGQISSEKGKTSSQGIDKSEKISSNFPSLPVDVTLTGSYNAFKEYLAALENNIRSMDARSIKFGITETDEEASILTSLGIFEFDLGVNVYYQ